MSTDPKSKSFADAGEKEQVTLVREVVDMIKHNKKWWLIPIMTVLLVFGGLLILGSTGAAPFIYALF